MLWIILLIGTLCFACQESKEYRYAEGAVYGTYYHISYQYPLDLQVQLREEMERVNASLSMFNAQSVISRLNRSETDTTDVLFRRMFEAAVKVNRETAGAFDITVAPLVNAWGFGFKHDTFPAPEKIDSLRQWIGMEKLNLQEGRLYKQTKEVEMDASSIAKGLGVDLVAEFLESKGIADYMVEIGGEVRVKGRSSKNRPWRIGIDKPVDDPQVTDRQLQMVVELDSGAMATSGNYRNFYIREGKKYAHTIDPRTGYPVQRDILGASVYASDCMKADAYATAFMVLGLEDARRIIEENPHLEGCLIYEREGEIKTWISDGLQKKIVK